MTAVLPLCSVPECFSSNCFVWSQAQRKTQKLETRLTESTKLVHLLNERPTIQALRKRFAVREAVVRLLLFVVVVGMLGLVSPFSSNYPSHEIATNREGMVNSLTPSLSLVRLSASAHPPTPYRRSYSCCLLGSGELQRGSVGLDGQRVTARARVATA